MKSVFRTTCIFFLIVAAGFAFTGCAKHPKPAESISPSPAAPAEEKAALRAPVLTLEEMKKIVVARVNGVEIHEDALVSMTNIMSANTPTSPAAREELRKKALDQVVLRELALQKARVNLHVDKRDLDRAMRKFFASMGHDEGFEDYLKEQHTTVEEVRAQIEKSLLFQQLFSKEVLEKVSVSEDEARKEFESHKDQYVVQDKLMSYDEAKAGIEKKLKTAGIRKRIEEWEQELKKDAKIEIIEDRSQK